MTFTLSYYFIDNYSVLSALADRLGYSNLSLALGLVVVRLESKGLNHVSSAVETWKKKLGKKSYRKRTKKSLGRLQESLPAFIPQHDVLLSRFSPLPVYQSVVPARVCGTR